MKIIKEATNIYYDNLHSLNSEDRGETSPLLAKDKQGEWNIVIYNSSNYQSTEENKTQQTKPLYAEVI